MSKAAKGASRRKYLASIYKRVFGHKPPIGQSKEMAKALIAKLQIPYVPCAVKMETFVSSWIRKNKPEFAPATPSSKRSIVAKTALLIPITTFPGGSSRPDISSKEAFYKSWEWRTLRMEALKLHGARCQCCGASRSDIDISGNPVRIVVDHILPLAKRWDLRLELTNLQILCDECNQGKGAWDRTDWRAT